MNRVSPMIDEIFDCSADSFNKHAAEQKGKIVGTFCDEG